MRTSVASGQVLGLPPALLGLLASSSAPASPEFSSGNDTLSRTRRRSAVSLGAPHTCPGSRGPSPLLTPDLHRSSGALGWGTGRAGRGSGERGAPGPEAAGHRGKRGRGAGMDGRGLGRPGCSQLFFSRRSPCSWLSESRPGQVNLTHMCTSVVSCSDVVVNMTPSLEFTFSELFLVCLLL